VRKVLVVTYYWPPAGGPGVQRVLKFVKYFPKFGWQPIVLTVENGDYPAIDESLLSQIPSECKVYKTPVLEPFGMYRRFTGRPKGERLPTYVLSKHRDESLRHRFSKWVRANIFIPDARIGWYPRAVRKGVDIIHRENIDLIFSSSPPHTVQLIAKKLAKASGKKWVADFRDPWTEAFWAAELNKNPLARILDEKLEASVLRNVDQVATVSQGLADLFSAKATNQYFVVQNGFETIAPKKMRSDTFIILFFGHLSKHQNPETFFQAVAGLPDNVKKNLEIHFIGRIFSGFSDVFQEFANLNISVRDFMPHDQLMEFAQSASLLLRPVARSSYSDKSVGAKTFDYLALRKPILTLISTETAKPETTVSWHILNETKSGKLFDYQDLTGIAGFVQENFELWARDHYILLNNERELEKYRTESNVKNLVDLFDDVLHEG
jgi:glycosyltransferase involved in cell wall biosynthesis